MNFLVLQHLEIEPAALVGDLIVEAGHQLKVVRLYENESVPDSLDDYDGLLVMGGPMSANDLHLSYICDEIELLKHAIEIDFPVLGFCLGSQLLARAAGAEIIAAPVRELGWYSVQRTWGSADDPIFRTLEDEGLMVFQWHGETFTLPDFATLLATNADVPHQAFRLGTAQYGFQFHIEVNEPIIDLWVAAGHSERTELGDVGVAEIHTGNARYLPTAQLFCRQMTGTWLELCDSRTL